MQGHFHSLCQNFFPFSFLCGYPDKIFDLVIVKNNFLQWFGAKMAPFGVATNPKIDEQKIGLSFQKDRKRVQV